MCVCFVHFLVWIINIYCQLQGWSYLLLFTIVTIHKITPQERATKLVLIVRQNYSAFGNVVPVHHTTKTEVISPRMLNFGTCWRCVASYPAAFNTRRRWNKAHAHALAKNQTPVFSARNVITLSYCDSCGEIWHQKAQNILNSMNLSR